MGGGGGDPGGWGLYSRKREHKKMDFNSKVVGTRRNREEFCKIVK